MRRLSGYGSSQIGDIMNFKKCVIGQSYKAKFKQVHSDDELQDIELIFDGETEVLGHMVEKKT